MEIKENQKIVDEQLRLAMQRIKTVLVPTDDLTVEQAKSIIGTYRVAIEPNFISWMYLAYKTTKSDKARAVLMQNVNDEISQDHPKMLRDFARDCGVSLSKEHYDRASQPVLDMFSLLSGKDGLVNLTIATVLENTSLVFIPYLAATGKKLGCKDFTYTDIHGEADIEHAKQLYDGLLEEMVHSTNPWRTVSTAVDKTVGFLEAILRP